MLYDETKEYANEIAELAYKAQVIALKIGAVELSDEKQELYRLAGDLESAAIKISTTAWKADRERERKQLFPEEYAI